MKLDSELNFESAINDLIRRLSHKIFSLSVIRKDITVECAINLYKTMILPIADYTNFCLTPCTDKLKTKLQRLQNKALRICLKADRHTNIAELHRLARLAPIEKRREFDLLKIFQRTVYSAESKSYQLMINSSSTNLDRDPDSRPMNTSLINTRSTLAPTALTKIPNSEKFKKSMLYTSTSLWNNLSPDTRNIRDFDAYKATIRRQIYQPYLTAPVDGVVSLSNNE